MDWKINNIIIIFLLGLIPKLAASKCAAFNLYAIKPKGDGFTVYASSDSFDNDLVRTYGQRERRIWGYKFLTSLCLLYSECYGSTDKDMVFANCYTSGMQYISREQVPYKIAQNLQEYLNGMPNDASLRPSCREPTVEIRQDQKTGGSTIVASGLAGKTSAVDLQGAEESRWLQVQKLLNWMCREYARCLHTLKQAAVEHKCTTMGNKEIQESHTELMVMQLELYMKAVVHGDVMI